jgi:hypothetical protein
MLQNSLEEFLEIFFSFPKEITHLNDFSTLCTTIPHENLKSRLTEIIPSHLTSKMVNNVTSLQIWVRT